LPQDPLVQVYFNHEQSGEYTEPYRHQTRAGDDLEKEIVDTIATAKSTLDVAVMELRLPKIAQALVDRQKAGVKVRVILDKNYSHPLSVLTLAEVAKLPFRERDRYDNERQLSQSSGDAVTILRSAGIPIIDNTANGSAGSQIMHEWH
jgi:phosphatidylserine/phosphatidylglycerophosphate/cardiolipin synthase-like enzyme